MGIFRPDRGGQEGDPLLDVKIGLFFLAALLAVIGIVTGSPWIIYAGMLVIVLAILLRFRAPPS